MKTQLLVLVIFLLSCNEVSEPAGDADRENDKRASVSLVGVFTDRNVPLR